MEVPVHCTRPSFLRVLLPKPIPSTFVPTSMPWPRSTPKPMSIKGLRVDCVWGVRRSLPRWKSSVSELNITSEEEGSNSGGGDEELALDLELWEEETLKGEDEGKEPTDYERRAHLFAECARVYGVLLAQDKASAV